MVLHMESSDYQEWNKLNPHLAIPIPSRHSSTSKDSTPLQHQGLYPAIPSLGESEEREEVFILPSNGETKEYDDPLNPDAECGKTKIARRCKDHPEKHPVKLIPWDCTRPECPVCWRRWAKRATRKAKELIWNGLLQAQLFIYSGLILSSLIISVPPELYHLDYDGWWNGFRKSLKCLGAQGVASIFHMWRYRDKDGNDLQELPHAISWREFRDSGGSKVIAPHFHCVTIGKVVSSPVYHQKSGGWIYKKMNDKPLTKKDVAGILYYAFTHCAISLTKQRKTIRYYGIFTRVYVASEIVDWVADLCMLCEAEMEDEILYHHIVNGEDMFGLKSPAMKKVITRTWALRPKRSKEPS